MRIARVRVVAPMATGQVRWDRWHSAAWLAVLPFAALGLLLAVGCGKTERPRQIEIKKPMQVAAAIVVDAPRNTLWRVHMLGSSSSVDRNVPLLRRFVDSWQFDAATGDPTWTVPEGWQSEPSSDGEFAVFGLTPPIVGDDMERSPPENDSQRVTIRRTIVPEGITADEFARGHLNQWRSQVSVEPLTAEMYATECERTSLGELSVVWMNAYGREPDAAQRNAFGAVRPVAPSTPTRTEVDYELPPGWSVSPNPSGFAAVTLDTDGGTGSAQITVTPLTAASSWEENVVRWVGQIGAPAMDTAAIAAATVEITVDGTPATRIDLQSAPEVTPGDRLIAVRVVRGEAAWFVRIRGSAARVAAEESRFDAFLETLDLPD